MCARVLGWLFWFLLPIFVVLIPKANIMFCDVDLMTNTHYKASVTCPPRGCHLPGYRQYNHETNVLSVVFKTR